VTRISSYQAVSELVSTRIIEVTTGPVKTYFRKLCGSRSGLFQHLAAAPGKVHLYHFAAKKGSKKGQKKGDILLFHGAGSAWGCVGELLMLEIAATICHV